MATRAAIDRTVGAAAPTHRDSGDRAGRARCSLLRAVGGARLRPCRDRRRQQLLLRRDDLGAGAAPEAEASGGLRLHQPVRPHRRAIRRPPHPHDGDGAALYLGGDLEDDQHAERSDPRGLQGRLHAVLALGPEGDGRLSRRLQVVANRWPQASSATTRRPRSGRPSSSRNRRRSVSRWSRRKAKRNAVQALRLGDCPAPDAQLRHPETFR